MFKTRPIEMGVAVCLVFSKNNEGEYINMLDGNINITHNRIKYEYFLYKISFRCSNIDIIIMK